MANMLCICLVLRRFLAYIFMILDIAHTLCFIIVLTVLPPARRVSLYCCQQTRHL